MILTECEERQLYRDATRAAARIVAAAVQSGHFKLARDVHGSEAAAQQMVRMFQIVGDGIVAWNQR